MQRTNVEHSVDAVESQHRVEQRQQRDDEEDEDESEDGVEEEQTAGGCGVSTAWLPVDVVDRYFRYHLRLLPFAYVSMDNNRMTMSHFALAGLELLCQDGNAQLHTDGDRRCMVEWIYAMQVGGDDGQHDVSHIEALHVSHQTSSTRRHDNIC
jgi:hypothetical protein